MVFSSSLSIYHWFTPSKACVWCCFTAKNSIGCEVIVFAPNLQSMLTGAMIISRWGMLTHRPIDKIVKIMMTSSNGIIFRVTGLLWGEFTGHRSIPRTKASDAELWCLLWSAPELTAEQTMETPVIWDAFVLIMTSLRWYWSCETIQLMTS